MLCGTSGQEMLRRGSSSWKGAYRGQRFLAPEPFLSGDYASRRDQNLALHAQSKTCIPCQEPCHPLGGSGSPSKTVPQSALPPSTMIDRGSRRSSPHNTHSLAHAIGPESSWTHLLRLLVPVYNRHPTSRLTSLFQCFPTPETLPAGPLEFTPITSMTPTSLTSPWFPSLCGSN